MCKLSKIWTYKNYCHLKPRCVKCAGDHLTSQCHQEERSGDIQCVICDENHPENYKRCRVYKEVRKKTYPPLRFNQYTPRAQIKHTLHTQPGVTCAQIIKQDSYAFTNIEQEPHTNQLHQQTSVIQGLKI
jgi:hypothetical protein